MKTKMYRKLKKLVIAAFVVWAVFSPITTATS